MAHEILLRLVSTCKVAYRIVNGSKWKVIGTVLLDSDSGVHRELNALDELTNREAQLSLAYTFVNTTKTANQVLQNRQQFELQIEDDKDTQFLNQYLGPHSQDKEWRRHMDRKNIPFEPGSWIKNNEIFIRWSEVDQSSTLFLTGSEATGKSILMSRIVEILQESGQGSNGVRVAYFFTSGSGKRPGSERPDAGPNPQNYNKSTMDIALRAMALQLSKGDDIYRKNLLVALRKHVPQQGSLTTNVIRLFELLFIKSVGSSPFFLLFDDLHNLSDYQTTKTLLEIIDKQPSQVGQFSLKILATAQKEENGIYQKAQESGLKVLQIDLELENKDIAWYAQHEVRNLAFLEDPAF